MHIDDFNQIILSENDLCDLFMRDPERTVKKALTNTHIDFDIECLRGINLPKLSIYESKEETLEQFDDRMQSNWHMPESYKKFDIAAWVLSRCKTDDELQRAGDELIKFQDRDMFPLLCYVKYLVDTMKANGIVWGVGRGSSVASFVLFLIGIHRINSLYWDLSIDEFLK
jgi:DNA polymerase III alpha subunit